jgi:hypothetical protein
MADTSARRRPFGRTSSGFSVEFNNLYALAHMVIGLTVAGDA